MAGAFDDCAVAYDPERVRVSSSAMSALAQQGGPKAAMQFHQDGVRAALNMIRIRHRRGRFRGRRRHLAARLGRLRVRVNAHWGREPLAFRGRLAACPARDPRPATFSQRLVNVNLS
jgi:hypothetical protein